MRTKLVTLAAVGALAVGGAAVAGTAIAATGDTTPTPVPGRSYAPPAPGARPDGAADRQQRIKDALAGLVQDGTLTQAQADKVAETLAAKPGLGRGMPGLRGTPGKPGMPPGLRGGGHGLRAGFAAAAKALGLSETELMTRLRAGKSLAAVAEDQGVPVAKVVDALVSEAQQRLADAVRAGRLTQAQADERLKDLRARVTERVNATPPQRPGRGPGAGQPAPPAPGGDAA